MSAEVVVLEQGSEAWHAHRQQYRNASETPAVMGLSPFVTPYQLWTYKTGRAVCQQNYAMQRGTLLEPKARDVYEAMTGLVMEPQVLVNGLYSASLDGLLLTGDYLLEIKCPMKGRESDTWRQAEAGDIPEHYWWQVQHQLMVSEAELAHFFVFDGISEGVMVEVKPEPDRWHDIFQAWASFQRQLDADTPPPLQENDVELRQDREWQLAAEAYRQAKQQMDAVSECLAETKCRLLGLCTAEAQKGYGVRVSLPGASGKTARVTLYQEDVEC